MKINKLINKEIQYLLLRLYKRKINKSENKIAKLKLKLAIEEDWNRQLDRELKGLLKSINLE